MNAVLQYTEHDDLIISFDPAIGEEIGRISVTPAEDVEAAVNRAREVFHKWKTTSFGERKALVMKAREVILAEMDEIAHLISRESGKPFGEAIATAASAANRGHQQARPRTRIAWC